MYSEEDFQDFCVSVPFRASNDAFGYRSLLLDIFLKDLSFAVLPLRTKDGYVPYPV